MKVRFYRSVYCGECERFLNFLIVIIVSFIGGNMWGNMGENIGRNIGRIWAELEGNILKSDCIFRMKLI